MSRRARVALAFALATLTLLPLAAPTAGAAPRQADDEGDTTTATGDATYDELAGCVAQNGRLLVVLLMDESGSLRQTDPQAVRVAAAKTALTGLAGLTDASSGGAKVDVQISTFSNVFRPTSPWSRLTRTTLPTLQTTVDTLAARNSGMDTDFINALSGARESMAAQAVATGSEGKGTCKAILLFTDGRYDLGIRATDAQRKKYGDTKTYAPNVLLTTKENVQRAQDAGVEALCKKDGVADQVRADSIATLTIALTAKIRKTDQDFLEAVTSGKGGDAQTCGKRSGAKTGVFLPASDLESLIGTFDAVATRIAGGSPVGGPKALTACQAKACDAGRTSFASDTTLRRSHLFVTIPTTSTRIQLLAPGQDDPLVLNNRTTGIEQYADTQVRVAWPSPKAATIDFVPTASSSGSWTVTLVDPNGESKGGSVQVYAFSDLIAVLASQPTAVVGKATKLTAKVTSRQGGKAVTNLRTADISAVITDPVKGGSTTVALPLLGKVYAGGYTPDKTLTSSVVRVVLKLNAVTRDGVRIQSTSGETSLNVRKPDGYPILSPNELLFSPIDGKQSSSAELDAFGGGVKKPGCVWFGEPNITAKPPGSGTIALSVAGAGTTEATCVSPQGAAKLPMTVRFSPSARASGTVRGWVRVYTKSAGGEPLPTDIPFSFEMARGIDKTKRLAVFAGLLLLGIGLPLALLLLMNKLSTRFQAVEHVQGAVIDVVLRKGKGSGREITRVGAAGKSEQLLLFGGDFRPIPPSDSDQHFTWAGLAFTARTPLNPFAPSYAVAAPAEGVANVAREGRRVSLALSLAGSWLFLYDPTKTDEASIEITGTIPDGEPPEIHGRLVTFVAAGPVAPQVDRLLDDIRQRLPVNAKRLSEIARDSRPS